MRFLKVALALCGLAFLIRFGYSAWFSTLTQDDFCQLGGVLEHGYLGGQWLWWQTWQGRWSSVGVNTAFAWFSRDSGFIACFGVTTLALVWSTFAAVFKRLGSSTQPAVLLSLFLTFLWYSVTLNVGESWYWIAACTSYVWPVCSAIWGVLVLLGRQRRVRKCVLGFLLFAFTTGCSEAVGALTLVGLSGYVLTLRIKLEKWDKPALWALAGSALSFAAMALSPGNKIRLEQTQYEMNLFSVIKSIPDSLVILGILIHFKKIWLLGALLFGQYLQAGLNFKRPHAKTILYLMVASILTSNALILPSEITAGGPPADRSWVLQSLVLVLFCVALGASIKLTVRLKKITQWSFGVLCLIATGYQISLFLRDKKGIDEYARGYAARMDHLVDLRQSGQSQPVELSPLPFTQYYHTAEIGTEHSWVNVCLERGMRLPFQVFLKD